MKLSSLFSLWQRRAGRGALAVLCVSAVWGPCHGRADVLARYDISSQNGSTDLSPMTVGANMTVSAIRRVGGLTPNTQLADASAMVGNPNFAFVSTDWPEDAFGPQAMEITFTPAPGYGIRFSSVKYAFGGFPKMTFRIATSGDGFSSSIFGPFVCPEAGYIRDYLEDSLAALPLQTGPITFRWYAFLDSSVEPAFGGLWAGFFDEDSPNPIIFSGIVQPVSNLRITDIDRLGSDLRLRFTSASGSAYRVEYKADLNAPNWLTLASNLPGTGNIVEYTDLGALTVPEGRRFYRVVPMP